MTTTNARLTRRAFLGGAAAFGIASLAVPHVSFADELTSAEVQAQADEARSKLDAMRIQLGKASDAYNSALEEHDTATAKMDESQKKIDENTAKISELQESLGGRARGMYRDGQITFLDVLLGSSSFDDFLKNWDTLQTLNDADADMVSQTKTLREDNEKQKAEYESQAQLAKQKMDEASAAQAEAEQLVNQYQAEVDSLDAQVAELLEEERRAAEEAAAKEAAKAEAAAQEASSGGSDGGNSGSDGNADGGGSSNDGLAGGDDGGSAGGNGGGSTGGNSGGNSGGGSSSGGSSSGGSSGGGSNSYGSAVLSVAQAQIGVPYVWGGKTPAGFDCSGLTRYCWLNGAGIEIGGYTGAQYASADWIGSVSQAQVGDVLYTDGHVGICASSGGGSYIHAPQPGESVCYQSSAWWNPWYAALRWY